MPGSVTSVFSEADEFVAALLGEGGLGLLVTVPGMFRARLTQVALHRIHLSAAEEYLPRIAFVAVPHDMILVSFANRNEPSANLGWDREASRRHDYSRARPARAHENRGALSLDRHPNARP
jgi:hypothetical protein